MMVLVSPFSVTSTFLLPTIMLLTMYLNQILLQDNRVCLLLYLLDDLEF